jgi:hypothetical protein
MGAGAYLHQFTSYWPIVSWLLLIIGGISMAAALVLRMRVLQQHGKTE